MGQSLSPKNTRLFHAVVVMGLALGACGSKGDDDQAGHDQAARAGDAGKPDAKDAGVPRVRDAGVPDAGAGSIHDAGAGSIHDAAVDNEGGWPPTK